MIMNKLLFPIIAAMVMQYGAARAEGPKAVLEDLVIEVQPSEPPGAPNPRPAISAKRKPFVERRRADIPEVKAFSFTTKAVGFTRMSRALVVRSTTTDEKSTAQLQEDLAVMARIIEKAAAEYKDDQEQAAGIPIVALAGGRQVRPIYLEDYGVLFTLTVNIPLRAEPSAPTTEADEVKLANAEWTEARNELFGDRRPSRRDKPGRREYNAELIEEFRESLVEALRNAGNIRHLSANDWITLVVRGRGAEDEVNHLVDMYLTPPSPPAEERTDEASTLVLRVKKSDADLYAQKKLNDEAFAQKVSITIY
jgi:hypothetical protein